MEISTNQLQIFQNEEIGEIRVVEINDEAYLVGKDVAVILGYSNPQDAIKNHVEPEDRIMGEPGVTPSITDSMGRKQYPTLINESGFYSMVFGSHVPIARKFKKWVAREVLPEIRRTGGYNMPKTYAEALRALADKSEEAERLLIENKKMEQKADFFDAVADSKDAISMADVAKVLDMGVGRNKLFEFLRDKEILQKDNRPYQKYIDRGYFRVVEQKFDKPYGEIGISIKTLVFQSGVDYIRKRLVEEGET